MNLGTAHIIRANSRNLPLADDSVDLVVTSPPYFALRSYQDGGEHYAGQIGDEPTPAEFVDSLIEVTRECVRVLKPSGSIFVNLGDKYAGSDGTSGGPGSKLGGGAANGRDRGTKTTAKRGLGNRATGAPIKSLIGIPWRYALRCIDDLGLILRAEVIWSKPNGLPESVTDRVRRSHETWFHFTLNPRYFSAVDEIREPHNSRLHPSGQGWLDRNEGSVLGRKTDPHGGLRDGAQNPLGKLPGSVWQIATEPLRVPDRLGVDHFAAFPSEFPKRIIQGWSPAGVCVECREGRRPVGEKSKVDVPGGSRMEMENCRNNATPGREGRVLGRHAVVVALTGYACACPEPTAPTTPAVVLDPFGGTGTTAMVAKALGRTGISGDMSADYCRLAEWRCSDRDQLAKVLGIDKADPVADDEQSLLDLIEGGAA